MRKQMIRLLSLMLCLITLVSLLPVTASAAYTLGTPKSLTWNKVNSWDGLETNYGYISFKPTTPCVSDGPTWYELVLYRDGASVYRHQAGWNVCYMGEDDYCSFNFGPFMEKSGTYHFTVQPISRNGNYNNGKVVKSKTWKYTKPSTKMSKPTNVSWDFPYMTWSGEGPFHLKMYYSPTKPDSVKDMQIINAAWEVYDNGYELYYEHLGPGYYAFQVRTMSTEIKKTAHSNWVTSDIYHIKLDAPVAEHSAVESSGKPKISWNEIDEAEKYEVYRATSKDGDFKKVKTTTSKSYTDKDAKAGKNYYYKVRGVTANGAKSSYSNVVNRYCDLPRPEIKISTTSSSGKIKVSWDAISGAEKYVVYRANGSDDEYVEVKTTTSTSYSDPNAYPADQYWYKVKALHKKSSANSALSEAAEGTAKLARPDLTVKNASSTGFPKLSWDEVDYAIGYKVYRATSSDGTYKDLAEVSSLTYTDNTAKVGKKYYYKVSALYYESTGNSSKSGDNSATCKLPRPDVSIALKSSGDPKLTWDAVDGAEKYYVYRATSKSGDYEKVKSTTSLSYTDKDAKAGKTYYYKVKAIHEKSAANSSYSSVDSIKAK